MDEKTKNLLKNIFDSPESSIILKPKNFGLKTFQNTFHGLNLKTLNFSKEQKLFMKFVEFIHQQKKKLGNIFNSCS
jgi:hypothetical protein